jgi:hypothetical protein
MILLPFVGDDFVGDDLELPVAQLLPILLTPEGFLCTFVVGSSDRADASPLAGCNTSNS